MKQHVLARCALNIHRKEVLKRALVSVVCPLLLAASGSASTSNAWFHNLWLDDGLPGKTVWAVDQDSLGFLWSGGEGGIARFDGVRFQNFPFRDTQGALPPSAIIRDLAISSDDTLWIGTLRDGIYRGVPYTTSDRISTIVPVESAGNSVRSVLLTGSDVYAGTSAGVELWNPQEDRFEVVNTGDEISDVVELYSASEREILFGTVDGLFSFDTLAGMTTPIAANVLGGSTVYFVLAAPEGHIWAGTDRGLARIGTDRSKAAIVEGTSGFTVFSGSIVGDEMWFGTRDFGVFRTKDNRIIANYDHEPRKTGSLSDSAVTAMHVDNAGALWLGTFSGGLDRLDPSVLRFGWQDASSANYECLSDSEVYALLPEGPSVWLGTIKELARVNTKTSECTRVSMEGRPVMDIVRTKNGSLWVATRHGVARVLEAASGPEVGPAIRDHFSYFLASVDDQTLIYGSPDGLFRVNPHLEKAELISITDGRQPSVYSGKADANGVFWLATSTGLYRWNATSGASPVHIDSLPENPRIEVIAPGKSSIWLGATGHGLTEIDPETGSTLSRIPAEQIGEVSAIIELTDDVWITTTNGLFRYDPNSGIHRRYGARDGLQSDVFIRDSLALTPDGRLFAGGRRGWNVFRPEDIRPNLVPPKIALTGLRLFNEPVRVGDESGMFSLPSSMEALTELTLSHRNDNISVEFAALHFVDPSRNILEYRMEGFDAEWSRAQPGQRSATYTNLPWGDYVFRVRAANKDGVWNLDGVSLPITVQTPIWAQWWAFVVYVLVLLGLAMAYAQFRSAAAIRRAEELQQTVNLRTRELAERNQRVEEQKSTIEELLQRKNSLFANVSHEFRTPLTLILGPLDDLIDNAKGESQKPMFRRIRRNAERLLHLVDQLLFLARTSTRASQKRESVRLDETVDYLATSFRPLAQKKRLHIDVGTLQPCRTLAIPDAIETMVSNLLSNAIKYTPDGGTVVLNLTQADGFARLEVKDSGVGLSDSERSAIFDRFTRLPEHQEMQGTGIGLALVRELAEAHGGQIEVESQSGHGSVFSLLLPLAVDCEPARDQSSNRPPRHIAAVVGTTKARPRVLVIDDDHDMLSYVTECLARDFHCVTAIHGKQGLEKALDIVPDLIVSDVMMPEMDGIELSRRIREDERLSHIPIVLLTARGGRDSRIKAWDAYVDEYIVKPFHSAELRSRLHSLLNVRELLRTQVNTDLTEVGRSNKLNKKEQAFVDRLTSVVEHRFAEFGLTRADLASDMAVSERQLQRKLKSLTNQNPSEFLREFRLRKAKALLADGEQVTLASEKCGFASPSQFGHAFKKRFGTTPKKFQVGAQNRSVS